MKAKIKKLKTDLKLCIASALLTITLAAGVTTSVVGYANVRYADFSSDSEIEQMAESLDCDLSYAQKIDGHYSVMKHNGDEPIYVSFDKNVTEQEIAVATEVLDYAFGIINKINSNYRYEIVDNETYERKSNKTRIYIMEDPCEIVNNFGDEVEMSGLAHTKREKLSRIVEKSVTADHTIQFNRNSALGDMEIFRRILLHELSHNLGMGDVHTLLGIQTTDKYYGHTFMNSTGNFNTLGMYSPNDLKMFVSLYMNDDSDRRAIKKMLDEYEQFYYETYANFCKEKLRTNQNVELEDFCLTDKLHVTDMNGEVSEYIYDFIIVGDSYELVITNAQTNKVLDRATGGIVRVNGTIILKDVELKRGMRPLEDWLSYSGGYEQDLIIVSALGKVGWYDLSTNDFRHYGEVLSLEKDMGI